MWPRLCPQARYLSQSSEQWKKERVKVPMTASRAPDVLGVGYNSPFKAWKQMKGIVDEKDADRDTSFLTNMQNNGSIDEDIIVDTLFVPWAENFFGDIAKRTVIEPTGLWQHEKYLWLAASPDRRVQHDGTMSIMEVKSRQAGGDAQMPTLGHYVQMQVQLACVPTAQYCWYVSGNVRAHVEIPLMVSVVHFDPALFDNTIRPKLEQFIDPAYKPPARSTRNSAAIEASYTTQVTKLYPY